MKYLSFKVLILAILMPPLFYLATIHGLEQYYLTGRYQNEIENTYLADMDGILGGEVALQESIRHSIERYMNDDLLVRLGIDLDVTVATAEGEILYPPPYQPGTTRGRIDNQDPIETARNNFEILQNGLTVDVSAVMRLYSAIALAILLVYILLTGCGLYLYFNTASFKARLEEQEQTAELERLQQLENEFSRQFDRVAAEREELLREHQRLQSSLEAHKQKAARNEEEMFEEIEKLEARLSENLEEQELQTNEILELEDKIGELEKLRGNINRHKEKNAEKLAKRFRTLYKNIDFHERSLSGIADLTDDMALKAEEVIHQLDVDSTAVVVKRKVFSRKGKINAFEVVFAYNGRIYFKKNEQQRIDLLAVGTKNTQAKDLAYLDRVHLNHTG